MFRFSLCLDSLSYTISFFGLNRYALQNFFQNFFQAPQTALNGDPHDFLMDAFCPGNILFGHAENEMGVNTFHGVPALSLCAHTVHAEKERRKEPHAQCRRSGQGSSTPCAGMYADGKPTLCGRTRKTNRPLRQSLQQSNPVYSGGKYPAD